MTVGDTSTSSFTFDISDETSKPPHKSRPGKPAKPDKPPKKRFKSVTKYATADIEASTPTIEPDAVVPFLIGRQRAYSPNVLWYGNYRTKYEKEVREESKTVVERKKLSYNEYREKEVVVTKTVTTFTPVDFYITVVVGLCLGPHVRLKAIYSDNELIWSGDTVDGLNTLTLTDKTAPFDTAYFYSGEYNQAPDPYLVSLLGDIPGFVGNAYIVIPTIASKDYGQSSLSYELERTEFLDNIDGVSNPANGTGDINAASMIYEILRSNWSGLGLPAATIDDTTFYDFYQTCQSRNYYFSFLDDSEDFGTGYIETICGLIGSIIYVDLETEKIKVAEFHFEDYNEAEAIPFDENDIISVQGLSRFDWSNMPTHYNVDFSSRRENYKKSSIPRLSNSVNTDDKRGEQRLVNLKAMIATERDVAKALLTRAIEHNGVPVMQLNIRTNTKGQQCIPGSAIKFSWSKYGIVDAPFWVTNIKSTDLRLNQVVLEGFYFMRPSVGDFDDEDTETEWTPVDVSPIVPVYATLATEEAPPPALKRQGVTPRYSSDQPDFAAWGILFVRAENEAQVAVNVHKSNSGEVVKGNHPYAASGFLVNDMPASYKRETGYIGDLEIDYPTNLDIVDNEGGTGYMNGEWFRFTHVTRSGNVATVHNVVRGLWGSVLKSHLTGDVFYMIDDADRLIGPYEKDHNRVFDLVPISYQGVGIWPTDKLDLPPKFFGENVNVAIPPIAPAINGARWYPGDTVTIYLDTPVTVSWLNQSRRSITLDGIADPDQWREDTYALDDIYNVNIYDSASTEVILGTSEVPFPPATEFGFTHVVFTLTAADVVPGSGTLQILHVIGEAIPGAVDIPIIIEAAPGLLAEISLDYRVGFAAELTLSYLIVEPIEP